MCFYGLENKAIFSLYDVNRLVYKTETEDVYCEVRSESFNTFQFNLHL